MIQTLLREVNSRGLDLYQVVQKAAEMDALNGSSIRPDMLMEVLAACAEEHREDEQTETPIETAIRFASEMDEPLNVSTWNMHRPGYERHLKTDLPNSDEILEEFGTWEKFWEQAGFDFEEYTPGEIIEITMHAREKGHLAIKEFDAKFPETPSGSYVSRAFGENWRNYGEAVSRARAKKVLPKERIDELIREGALTVKQIQKTVAEEYRNTRGIDALYKRPTRELYKHISERKSKIHAEAESRRLTRTDIVRDHGTLDDIANRKIKHFRIYSGVQKARKREQIVENTIDYLIDEAAGKRLAYLGLEGVNFKSYILLQQMLDNVIDPSSSLVAECNQPMADAMEAIIENHDAIEGGEIFEELALSKDYVHKAVKEHADKRFDLINLDYMGGWSRTKESILEHMFKNGQIAESALIYVTLLNSEREKEIVRDGKRSNGITRKAYDNDDQAEMLENKLKGLCRRHKYELIPICADEYFDTQKMLFCGFYVTKR